jgi:hypothetical protein
VEAPHVLPNRINIDTGAYLSGHLTCLVLEGEHKRFLTAERKPTERPRPAATPRSPGSLAGSSSDGGILTDLEPGTR